MNDAWKQILYLLELMRPLLMESGVPEDRLQMPTGDVRRVRCGAPSTWIRELYDGPWMAANKIKRLLPQERWDYYKLQGFEDMREQLLLADALKVLRQAWKTGRPTFFGRKPSEKAKATITEADNQDSA